MQKKDCATTVEEAEMPASDMPASLEDGIARLLRACVETPTEAVFERDDGIAPYEKHMLTTVLLRPRRLSSTVREHRRQFSAARSRS